MKNKNRKKSFYKKILALLKNKTFCKALASDFYNSII
jgi:hypothetical protein